MPVVIHPTAIVSDSAVIGDGSTVGAYAIIEDDVVLGESCNIDAHAIIKPGVRMGTNNRVHSFAVIGDLPQDIGFDPRVVSYVEIGNDNVFREGVTIHRSKSEGGKTIFGNRAFLMANSHIGHDCIVKDGLIMANGAVVGGHTEIDDDVFLSGNVAVHQLCKIGTNVIIGGVSKLAQDAPPYAMIDAKGPTIVYGLNLVGMRRRKISRKSIAAVEAVYDDWYSTSLTREAFIAEYSAKPDLDPCVKNVIDFFRRSKRGILARV